MTRLTRPLDDDTIVAVSTPPGEGGLGVVRLSGPDAVEIADRIFASRGGRPLKSQKSHTVRYGHVVSKDPASPVIVDEALALVMRSPKSYTREDVVEISVHGGTAVLRAVVDLALKEGARAATPGEFTKRAFLNGRIDLIQAEAVLDLIRAKTELGRRWASARLDGVLSGRLKALKDALVGVLSHLEAAIDFPEDETDADASDEIAARLRDLSAAAGAQLESAGAGIVAGEGLSVVLAGRPNTGKSSLMNRLARADRVIVTPHPGTTRDVVEETVSIGGFPVRLSDTAGIRPTEHPIEKEGIDRSRRALAGADLVLFVIDASEPFGPDDEAVFAELKDMRFIPVLNKTDLAVAVTPADVARKTGEVPVLTSCMDEDGTRGLEEKIVSLITRGGIDLAEEAVVGTVRQKDLLEKTRRGIDAAALAAAQGLSAELVAVDVRAALTHLGQLTGDVVQDDVLEALFSRFCIGK